MEKRLGKGCRIVGQTAWVDFAIGRLVHRDGGRALSLEVFFVLGASDGDRACFAFVHFLVGVPV